MNKDLVFEYRVLSAGRNAINGKKIVALWVHFSVTAIWVTQRTQ